MKQTIRLNERELHNLISESVNRILNEVGDTLPGQYRLGLLAGRKNREFIEKYGPLAFHREGKEDANGDIWPINPSRSIFDYASDRRKEKMGHDNAYLRPTDKEDEYDINPYMDANTLGYQDMMHHNDTTGVNGVNDLIRSRRSHPLLNRDTTKFDKNESVIRESVNRALRKYIR